MLMVVLGGSRVGNGASHGRDCAGDGGIAGKGGTVSVSNNCKIFAFNGNKFTDDQDYKDGENQLEIFAQHGVLREVYKYTSWWGVKENYNSEFFSELMGESVVPNISDIKAPVDLSGCKNVLIRNETTCSVLSEYVNSKTNNSFGIGSGAGYIELSNGTFTINSYFN